MHAISAAQESVAQRLLAYLWKKKWSCMNYRTLLSTILEVNVFGTWAFRWHAVFWDMQWIPPPLSATFSSSRNYSPQLAREKPLVRL